MIMIEFNIFRPLPSVNKAVHDVRDTGIEQQEVEDHTWRYLQGIYEIFLELISQEAIQVQTLKIYITE